MPNARGASPESNVHRQKRLIIQALRQSRTGRNKVQPIVQRGNMHAGWARAASIIVRAEGPLGTHQIELPMNQIAKR